MTQQSADGKSPAVLRTIAENLRGWRLIAAAAALVALLAFVALSSAGGSRAGRSALLKVERMPFASVLHEAGTVEAFKETTVLTRFAGEIVWMANDGKLVEAGEPVVRFETKAVVEDIESREKDLVDKQEAVRRAEADIVSTQQRYKHLVRQAEIAYELAELDRKKIHDAPTPDEKREAELSLKSAELELKRAELEMLTHDELAKQGFVSEAKRKEKQLDLATKKVNFAKSKMILDLTLMGYTADAKRVSDLAVADAKKRLGIARFNQEADLSVAKAGLELAKVDLENFERELKRKRQELEWATVAAPVRGHVVFTEVMKGPSRSRSPIQVGESRSAGADLGIICDTSALRIQVWLNESDLAEIAPGQRAAVTLPALPGRRLEAVVSEVAVLAMDKNVAISSLALRRSGEAFVNVVQAKLEFVNLPEDARKAIRVGYTTDVFIQTSEKSDALTIPWAAVKYDAANAPYAEAAAWGGRERRPLKLGRGDVSRVEVLEGLKENEQVYDLTGASVSGAGVSARANEPARDGGS